MELSFAAIAAAILVASYFIQLTVMQPSLLRGEVAVLEAFAQYNLHGVFIALEDIGYILISGAFLFVAGAIEAHHRTARLARAGEGADMNHATRINAATVGAIFGLSGMTHGFAETLQGNTPTSGLFINAVAADSTWSRWPDGGEGAFTIVPNFLATGILAMLVGLAIIVWSLGFVQRRHGPTIYLLLFVLLFLVGGGIGQVLFFIPAWMVATRIHAPLTWWRRALPAGLQHGLARAWPWLLAVAAALILMALVIATFGYIPGVSDMEQVLNITLTMVGAALLGFLLAFAAGFAADITRGERRVGQFVGSVH